MIKIAILGRKKDTGNYEGYLSTMSATPLVTLSLGDLSVCDCLLLPSGGDITPAFFGQHDAGSVNIDTELDILQLQALDYAVKRSMPVLGICKGMQLINVAFGGTLIQNLPTAAHHQYQNGDQYHATHILKGSCLEKLYGQTAVVNSAHHQGIGKLGNGLQAIQWCTQDQCVEAIVHERLPILGLQWHPERLDRQKTTLSGAPLWSLLSSWISVSHCSLPSDIPS